MAKKVSKKEVDVNAKIVEELLSKADPSQLFGKDGLFNQLKKQVVERVLESELDHNLDYSKHNKSPKSASNRCNGSYKKSIIDDDGHKLAVDIPRVMRENSSLFLNIDESILLNVLVLSKKALSTEVCKSKITAPESYHQI